MSKRYTDEKLMDLLSEGKSQRECAQILGVNESSISRRKKKIEQRTTQHVALLSAGRILEKRVLGLDTLRSLAARTQSLINIIDVFQSTEDKYSEEYRSVNQQLRRLVPAGQHVGKFLLELQVELRKQLQFYWDMEKDMVNLRRVKAFQDAVMEELRRAEPEVAERLRNKLLEAQSAWEALDKGGQSMEGKRYEN